MKNLSLSLSLSLSISLLLLSVGVWAIATQMPPHPRIAFFVIAIPSLLSTFFAHRASKEKHEAVGLILLTIGALVGLGSISLVALDFFTGFLSWHL